MSDKKFCYMVLETIRNDDGEFVLVIVKHGKTGYFITDLTLGKDFKVAEECARKKNKDLGLTKEDVQKLILQSM